MKLNGIKTSVVILSITFISMSREAVAENVTVNSLSELMTYAGLSDNDVRMTPGIYYINHEAIAYDSGIADVNYLSPVFKFSGNNNTFDFSGVTFEIDNTVYNPRQRDGTDNIIQISGNTNVLKNLTMIDVGSLDAFGGNMMIIGGISNTVDGFTIFGKGSKPYGYGSLFGKGGGSLVALYKKSGILIEGENCTLRNLDMTARFYGHCVYMQGAINTLIEDCTIEGEMARTDDILAEKSGTAFDLDFMTVWGYPIRPGQVISLQEAGIRCYGSGKLHYLEGVERNTENVTVRNCTVSKVREGITISDAKGFKWVEGCVVTDCETGYQMNGGTITNSSGNFKHGPVYANYSSAHKNGEVTINVLYDEPVDGANYMAFFTSSGHNVTLLGDGVERYGSDVPIKFGGSDLSVRHGEWSIETANNNVLNNQTHNPVYFSDKASNNSITTLGPVIDAGSGNSGNGVLPMFIPDLKQAEEAHQLEGVSVESATDDSGGEKVNFSNEGDHLTLYADVPGNGLEYVVGFRVASESDPIQFELRDGDKVLSTINRVATGGAENWTTIYQTIPIGESIRVLRIFSNGGNWSMNWFDFDDLREPDPDVNLAQGQSVTASSWYESNGGAYVPSKAVDGNTVSRWAAQGENTPWLEVDFGKETRVTRSIFMDYGNRTTSYEIQYFNDGWKTAFTGEDPGEIQEDSFPAVVGRKFRLQITGSVKEPSIYEFELYNDGYAGGELSFTSSEFTPDHTKLSWIGSVGKSYSIQSSTNLVTDPFTTTVESGIPGLLPMNTIVMGNDDDTVFYRIVEDE